MHDEISSSHSAPQSPAANEAEGEEVEASQKRESEEEVSSNAEEFVPVPFVATSPASAPVQSFGKVVVHIAKTLEPEIAAKAIADQKEIDAKNAKAAEAAALLAKVEEQRKPSSEKVSDQKLQDAKNAHQGQAAAETKARLEAYHLIPAKSAALAHEAKQIAEEKLPHIQAEVVKVLAAESEANKVAQAAAQIHEIADEEKAALKAPAGKVVKRVEVAQPTMAESIGKLPPKLAARFAETLAAVEKAGKATKVAVGTDEHAKGSIKSLVNLFETKNSQVSEAVTTATTSAPTHSIGKVVKTLTL